MTTAMITSISGSISFVKRARVVSTLSSKKSATALSISCSAPVCSPTSTIFSATSGNSRRSVIARPSDTPSRTCCVIVSTAAPT